MIEVETEIANPHRRTYKREFASGMFVLYACLVGFAAFTGSAAALSLCELLVVPVFLFCAGAYGLDWFYKQYPLVMVTRASVK